MAPDSCARYAAFLRGSLAAVEPLEHVLVRWMRTSAAPSRSAALRADLEALGEPELPDAVPLPFAIASLPEAFGAAYVVEGSALGGMVLADRVEQLGTTATSYLRLRGAHTGAAWRAFVVALASYAGPIDRACDVACATFDHYTTAFRAAGVLAS